MKDKKLLRLYFAFLVIYYILIEEIPFCEDKMLCLFQANSFFDFSLGQSITMNSILMGIINSIAIAYVSSLINQLRNMEVYIWIRLNGRSQTGFYYSSIFNSLAIITAPKFLIDLLMVGFGDLLLILVIQVSSFITLLLYAVIYLSLSSVNSKGKMAFFSLLALNFLSGMAYTKFPLLSIMVFSPYMLLEFGVRILLIKLLFILFGIVVSWVAKEKFARDVL